MKRGNNIEIIDDYIKEINANYWAEMTEMENGIHPTQIIERVRKILDKSGNNKKITFMDYHNFSGQRVGVFVDGNFYGVFNYEENIFETLENIEGDKK